jgi:hypothetical protein
MSEPLETPGQGRPYADSTSALADLFAPSAAERAGPKSEPTPRPGRRQTARRDKRRRPGQTRRAPQAAASKRQRRGAARERRDRRAPRTPFRRSSSAPRGGRPVGRPLLGVAAGLVGCAMLVAALGTPGGPAGHGDRPQAPDRQRAPSVLGREAPAAAGGDAATTRETKDPRRPATPKPGRDQRREVRQERRTPPKSPRPRAAPSAKRSPAPPAPVAPAPGEGAAAPDTGPPHEPFASPSSPEGAAPPPAPAPRRLPPPARRAPALPAPVPPGSPPEFL